MIAGTGNENAPVSNWVCDHPSSMRTNFWRHYRTLAVGICFDEGTDKIQA